MSGNMTFATEPAQLRIAKIQNVLRASDLSVHELADTIHISLRWAREYVRHLHAAGMIHVAEYRLQTQEQKLVSHALYSWGAAKDAPRPAPLSAAERLARRRAIMYQDKERHELEKAKRRHDRWVPHCDWAAAWIPKRNSISQENV